jgi:hypothetical protein
MRNLVLTISGLLALGLGVIPAADAVTISVLPEQGTVQAGSTTVVDVVASGLSDAAMGGAIGGYDLDLTFDPALLSWSSTTFKSGLDVTGLGDLQDSSLSGSGKLETFEVSFDSASDLAALQPNSFVLFSVNLTGIVAGTSALGLDVLSLTDESGHALASDVQGSSVAVAPVPLPAAAWLLLSGLGSALGFTRSRRTLA